MAKNLLLQVLYHILLEIIIQKKLGYYILFSQASNHLTLS